MFEMISDAIKIEINDRRGVKSKHLAEEHTTSDNNTKRPPQLREARKNKSLTPLVQNQNAGDLYR
jgi:hypothetical protein